MSELKCSLRFIEIENFKSYDGLHKIGPLKDFMSIIGPNGSGKSNLMDAISFVLGETVRNLRVRSLTDLIHGAHAQISSSKKARVSIIIDCETDDVIRFTRSVVNTSSEYRVNEEIVTSAEYHSKLEQYGINVKARNFLVFQGQIEAIAMKSGKDRAALFEELCRSSIYKADYERLLAETQNCENEVHLALVKRRTIEKDRKQLIEHSGGSKYNEISKDLSNQESQLALFQLKNNDNLLDDVYTEEEKTRKQIEDTDAELLIVSNKLKDEKDKQKCSTKDRSKLQEDYNSLDNKLKEKQLQSITIRQDISHLDVKFDSVNRALLRSIDVANKSTEHMESYKKSIADVEAARQLFELECNTDVVGCSPMVSQTLSTQKSSNRSISVEELQDMYFALREDADLKCTEANQRIANTKELNWKRTNDVADATRKLDEILKQMERQHTILTDLEQRKEQSILFKSQQEKLLTEKENAYSEIERSIHQQKEQKDDLQRKFSELNMELGEAKLEFGENSRQAKKKEVINNLKSITGVFGRLIDFCHPVHNRYQIALAKVIGKNIDAIIVDNQNTARSCIQMLKDRGYFPETFLPLNSIKVKTIDPMLSNIDDRVKLLIDLVKYEPADIKNAIYFAIGDTLVTNTDDVAREIAFGSDRKFKVVSLNGTLFNKSGVISGGSLALKYSASRFDEKKIERLQTQCSEIHLQLRNLFAFDESELFNLRSQNSAIRNRIIVADKDVQRINLDIQKAKSTIEELNIEKTKVQPEVDKAQRALIAVKEELNKLETNKCELEDEIFADFCKLANVTNIRVYENRELAENQKREQKRKEFNEQLEKLNTLLQFESSRNCQESITRLENDVKLIKQKYHNSKSDQLALNKIISEIKAQISECKSKIQSLQSKCLIGENTIADFSRRIRNLQEKKLNLKKQLNRIELDVEKLKLKRHKLLMSYKINDINIPFNRGSFDDFDDADIQIYDQSQQYSSDLLTRIFSVEDNLQFDFSSLPAHLAKKNMSKASFLELQDKMTATITQYRSNLKSLQSSMMRTNARLKEAQDASDKVNSELEQAREAANIARTNFEQIKSRRLDKFKSCFDHVTQKIDQIYKDLTGNPTAQAYLNADNTEEPYLSGISFSCVVPGKRFRMMESLSGGEKTLASIALLFAIRSYLPAPFFVLDEVDAALDEANINRFVSFLQEQSNSVQCLVISLKHDFFCHSDALIGVYSDRTGRCVRSKIIVLDLSVYIDDFDHKKRSNSESNSFDQENINPVSKLSKLQITE